MNTRSTWMLGGAYALLCASSTAFGQAVVKPNATGPYVEALQKTVYQEMGWVDGDPRFIEGQRFEPRMQPQGPGFPVLLTWSLVPDGLLIPSPPAPMPANPNNEGSSLFGTMDANFQRQEWLERFARCFDRWEDISGINFIFVDDTTVGPGSLGTASPTPPPGQDPADYEPVDEGDPWPAPLDMAGQEDIVPPGDGPEGYYDPSGLINADPENPVPMPNYSVGDIRIAARAWDGQSEPDGSGAGAIWVNDPPTGDPIGAADDGNIIFDNAEDWNDPLAPNFLEVSLTRAVAFAVGLNPYCPKSVASVLELQDGVDPVGPPTDPSSEPFPQLTIVQPQYVDILAVQKLYGDPNEVDDSYSSAIEHVFDISFDQVNGTVTLSPYQNDTPVSITEKITPFGPVPDADFVTFDVPLLVTSGELKITLTPQGQTYQSQGTDLVDDAIMCAGDIAVVDGLRQDNLQVTLQSFDPQTNVLTTLGQAAAGGAGDVEELALDIEPGRYYVIISGDPNNPSDDMSTHIQTYDISIGLTVNEQVSGLPLGEVLDGSDDIAGIGRPTFVDLATQQSVIADFFVPELEAKPYVGDTSVIVFMDEELPFAEHTAFDGRKLTTLFWPGVNSSIDVVGSHSTATMATAGGVSMPTKNFLGTSEPSELVAVNVARPGTLINGLFPVSLEAVYYSLFGLTDPDFAAGLGLSSTADIYVAAWNAPNADPLGAGPTALAHDAAASMRDVLVIASGGNAGNINNIDDPAECGPLFIGDLFVGARTIGTPASAYNALVVGACGSGVLSPSVGVPEYRLVPRVQSKGPLPSFNPAAVGGDIAVDNARSGLHIVAPGWSFIQEIPGLPMDATPAQICGYAGNQPAGLINLPVYSETEDPNAFGSVGGSSVAAAIIGGAAALLRDAGLENGLSVDPLVLKAVMMNSAVKQPGWSNQPAISAPYPPQDKITALRGNPLPPQVIGFTGQALDYAQGSGVVNLEQAFLQYFLGARDVEETDPALPTVSQFNAISGGEPPMPEAMLNPPASRTMLARADLQADRLSPEPEMFQQAQLGTPSGPPGQGGAVNTTFPSRPPAVPIDIGNQPGPGDPGFDPIGERTIRFFFEFVGLSDPDDPNSDANQFEDEINEAPLALTTNEVDEFGEPVGAQRFYIWAQMLGSDVTQDWTQISLNIGSTGDVEILEYNFFNYQLVDLDGPNPVLMDRWDEVEQGEQVDPGRIEGINLVADNTTFGVTSDPAIIANDGHFNGENAATLLGYVVVRGEGDLFFEVGGETISNEEDDAEDTKVLFGFGDEFDPPIAGEDIGVASPLADASTTLTQVLPVPVPVKVIGWDRANIGLRNVITPEGDEVPIGFIDYFIEEPMVAGQTLIATLAWDRTTVIDEANLDLTNLDDPNVPVTPLQLELENLDIAVIATDEFGNPLLDGEGVAVTLGQTSGTFDNVEHIVVTPQFSTYVVLRVIYSGRDVNVDVSEEEDGLEPLDPSQVEYALAWGVWNSTIFNTPQSLKIPADNQTPLPAQSAGMVQMQQLIEAFGTVSGQAGYNPAADLNSDGAINARDLNIMLGEQRGAKRSTTGAR